MLSKLNEKYLKNFKIFARQWLKINIYCPSPVQRKSACINLEAYGLKIASIQKFGR